MSETDPLIEQNAVFPVKSEIEPNVPQKTELTAIVDQEQFLINLQNYYSRHNENSKKLEWTTERIQNVMKLLVEYNLAKSEGRRPTNQQYHHANKYDTIDIDNQKVLIMKRKHQSDPIVQIIPTEDYYQRILDAHIATNHGWRDKIVNVLRGKYAVPIFAITIFLTMCKTCLAKKNTPKKSPVTKPMLKSMNNLNISKKQTNSRSGQIDLVDFQTLPDEEYKWLLQYQDHFTKYYFLRPLKSNQAKEVANEILKIILEVGCPNILQSDSGPDFTDAVLTEITNLWPACKIVAGKTQNQGSIESAKQSLKDMINSWMADNKSTNWSFGCYFVQFRKNMTHHPSIAKTPSKAMFGHDPKSGMAADLSENNIVSKFK